LPPFFVLKIEASSTCERNPTKNIPFNNHCLKFRQTVTLWHGLQPALLCLLATASLSRWFRAFSSVIRSFVGLKRYIGRVFRSISSLIAATLSSDHQIRILRLYIFRK
jgi:hypothetical protein